MSCLRRPRDRSEREFLRRLPRRQRYEYLVNCPHLTPKNGGSGWYCEKYEGYIDPRYGHGLCPAMRIGGEAR